MSAALSLFPVFKENSVHIDGLSGRCFLKCDEEAEKILARYPNINRALRKKIIGKNSGFVTESLLELEKFEREFLKLPLCEVGGLVYATVESKDGEIKKVCEKLADISRIKLVDEAVRRKAQGVPMWQLENYLKMSARSICAVVKVQCPMDEDEIAKEKACNVFDSIIAACARMSDEKWWRRKIRSQQARMLDHAARVLGLVNKKNGIYSATASYWRHVGRKNKNRKLLESLVAENQHGYTKTLAELADVGVSNPVNRANELITRVRGFEEWAARDLGKWVPMFYTLTAPSRFHSHNVKGEEYAVWVEAGRPNPRDAQEWLCSVWEKTRAEYARWGISVFGLRVAEPHHDSCPHWHIALWLPAHRVDTFNSIFRFYALDEDGDEITEAMRERRLKIESVKGANPKTGEPASMVGYVMKYITKNVNGIKNNGEEFEIGAIDKALRVEAWASTWGIRQFQQIGGAPVTVWRELRRLKDFQADEVREFWTPADNGDWCEFTDKMGGADVERVNLPLRPMYAPKVKDGERFVNVYGEAVSAITGLIFNAVGFGVMQIKTRFFEWRVYVASAKRALAWTCVNNCTVPDW